MPPLLPVLKLARLPAVLDRLAPAARVELDAHAFAQDATVGAGIRSQGRTLLRWWCHSQRCLEHGFNLWHGGFCRFVALGGCQTDPVDREISNVVSTGFPSESAPEEESPFEHEYAADASLIQVVEGTNG